MIRSVIIKTALVAAIGMLMLIASQLYAQPGPEKGRLDDRVAMLKEKLKLTDEQATKIRGIIEDEQRQAMAGRDKLKGDPGAIDKARAERRKAVDEKIKAVLDANQKKEFDKIKERGRKDGEERRDRRDRHERESGGHGGRR